MDILFQLLVRLVRTLQSHPLRVQSGLVSMLYLAMSLSSKLPSEANEMGADERHGATGFAEDQRGIDDPVVGEGR